MADRESFIQKMKALRDEMQAAYFKQFEKYITPIFLECPDIGLVHFATYTPYFNDGYDCEWDINCFSTFMKRDCGKIGDDCKVLVYRNEEGKVETEVQDYNHD